MAIARSAVAVLLAVLAALSASPAAASWNPCKPICYPWRQWHPRNCPWKHCEHAHNCWYQNKWTKKWNKGYRCVRRTPPTPKPTPPPMPTGPLCKPKCYPWPTWHPKDCPWKHCAHEQKCYYKNKYGKWVKGHRCVPRAPPTPTPTPAGPTCRPKCYPWPTWNARDCPWKHCAHDRKCYYKNKAGVWVKGHRCVPRTAATPTPAPASASPSPSVSPSPSPKVEGPPTFCPNKCYRKWRDARDTCNMAICQVRGCSFWKGGRQIWGFRCINKPVVKPSITPSPSAAPSPEAVYPNFCPLKCRRWKSAVAVLCNPAKCRVAACKNPLQPWGNGYNCVPLKPSAAPSTTPSATPSASASPSAKPVVVGPCEQRCRRNRWRVVRECDMAYCEVKGCVASGKKWKYGYECSPKVVKPSASASPSASPTPSVSPKVSVCGNKCLWSKKRWEVEDLCDPLKCRIVRCLPWKALKCVDK